MSYLMRLYERFPEFVSLRERAKEGRDPTCADDTLEWILSYVAGKRPRKILEIGCGEGITSCSMLLFCDADLTAIELEPERRRRAQALFERYGLENRVRLFEGDAAEILPMIEGAFDLIFLDGPKVQYKRYLPLLKGLLRQGGTLLSDDVLLFGRNDPVPPKRRALALHLREYLDLLQNDGELSTQVLELGKGLSVSVKL